MPGDSYDEPGALALPTSPDNPCHPPSSASLPRPLNLVQASCELAQVHGPYQTYAGSPVSKGILQPDMWGVKPSGVNGR